MSPKILQLLSYPKSGSTYLLTCMQYILETNISNENIKINDLIDIPLKNTHQIIRAHNFETRPIFTNIDTLQNKLLLIVRNYKECIPRYNKKTHNKLSLDQAINMYCGLVNAYCNWNNDKHIIYYEDFITNPVQELEKIVNELNISKTIEEDQINLIKEKGLVRYKNLDASFTNGKAALFHSLEIDKEIKIQYDTLIKKYAQNETINILNRYFETETN